jgi:hypothetical protein
MKQQEEFSGNFDLKQELIKHKGNTDFFRTLANDPKNTIQTLEAGEDFANSAGYEHYESSADPYIYHTVVRVLGIVAIASLISIVYLLAIGRSPSDALIALGSASIGALAGVLVPERSHPKKL